MAVLPTYSATLADLASRMDPSGTMGDIVNMLSQENPILDDMPWIEANNGSTHKVTMRTGLPQGAWRMLNYGVPYGKSTTAQVSEGCASLEAFSKVDRDLVRLAGDQGAAFRLSESMAFLEGMSQQMASALFYGNAAIHPERFNGLSPRFSTIDPAKAGNAVNVIDAGGRGSTNTSIWLLCWSPNGMFGIYPKGTKAGLSHENASSPAPIYDPNGNPYIGYQDHYEWKCGLAVKDWRYAVRIANIDVTTLTGVNAPELISLLIAAAYKLPTTNSQVSGITGTTRNSGNALSFRNPVIYMNRAVATALDFQSRKTPGMLLQYSEIQGRPQTTFRGIPVKVCDAILNTEAAIS